MKPMKRQLAGVCVIWCVLFARIAVSGQQNTDPPSERGGLEMICALLLGDVPWREQLLNDEAFKETGFEPDQISPVRFMEIARGQSGSYGLAFVSAPGSRWAIFYVRLDGAGNLRSAGMLYQSEEQFESVEAKLRLANMGLIARERVAQESPALDGGSPRERIDVVATEGMPFTMSGNGRFLSLSRKKVVSVRSLDVSSDGMNLHVNIIPDEAKDVWLQGVSYDGRMVSLVVTNALNGRRQLVLDLPKRKKLFSAVSDNQGFPKVTFFADSFTVLHKDRIDLYSQGELVDSRPFSAKSRSGSSKAVSVSRAGAAFLRPDSNDILVVFQGRQPLRLSPDGQSKPFADARDDGGERFGEGSLDGLGSSRSVSVYKGGSRGEYDVDSSWRYLAQIRNHGSDLDLSLRSYVDVFTTGGRLVGTVSPFWSIASVGLSSDGRWMAVAQEKAGPSWEPRKKKVWIYSTQDLLAPVLRIEGIEVLDISRLHFAPDTTALYVVSGSSRVILKYDLNLEKSM